MRRITIDFIQDPNAGRAGRFLVFINSAPDPTAAPAENTICNMVLPAVKTLVLKLMPTPTGIGTGKTLEESRAQAEIQADIYEAGEKEENGKS